MNKDTVDLSKKRVSLISYHIEGLCGMVMEQSLVHEQLTIVDHGIVHAWNLTRQIAFYRGLGRRSYLLLGTESGRIS